MGIRKIYMILSENPRIEIMQGDCLVELQKLKDESIDCCITSPPYWGLRDYGTAKWVGGDEKCNHKRTDEQIKRAISTSTVKAPNTGHALEPHYKEFCGRCGAKRVDNQLGLEKTPELYVAKMVEVFKEVKRVLKKEGTCWLNLGDTYSGSGNGSWNVENPEHYGKQ